MGDIIDLTGQTFGRLTVIEFAESRKNRLYWRCVCSCNVNVERIVLGTALKSGHTKSRGCLSRERASKDLKKHGFSYSAIATDLELSTYHSWQSLKGRCRNPNIPEYPNYGGRGVSVCERWLNSFENFLEDMGVKPSVLHSIDRYPDQNGIYELSNCRWATRAEQNRNLRTNVWFEHNGVKLIQTDWAEYFQVTQGNLCLMLKRKSFEELFNYYTTKKNLTWDMIGRFSSAGAVK